jgi:2-C-methyl-D-erythritol 2,4-cyclodiphosphate synthase
MRLGKIQTSLILLSAFYIFVRMKNWRIGHGYDVHRLAEGLTLRLGGVDVPHSLGCVAHSDGDVVIHALCDALLGAAALGDIGLHFPDTANEYKGIDSTELLRRTVGLVRAGGYEVGNVDCTIVLQAPKVRPFIDRMRMALAEAMGVDVGAVSVKATTTEKLGFTGRAEGVEAHAVVLLYMK